MPAFTVLWRALFLACSWTWCIGMFLPIFLISDFGVWGWVAFAIPNVFGAMAVGLIVATPERSRAIVERHGAAMRWFSAVTIAFHAYFLGQICPVMSPSGGVVGSIWLSILVLAIVFLAAAVYSKMSIRGWMIASFVTFALSITAAILIGLMSDGHAYRSPPAIGRFGIADLLWAAPALCFGFLLCPHLDRTFHRTRQETPGRAGDLAFVAGFALFFLALILFTLAYASSFLNRAWLNDWIALHFAAQIAFTVGAHWREWDWTRAQIFLIGFGAALGILLPIEQFRFGYDLFLYAYAIPFPAYVWIVMVPRGLERRFAIRIWLFASVLATPIFAAGYFGLRWWAIPLAIAIPLVAPAFMKRLNTVQA